MRTFRPTRSSFDAIGRLYQPAMLNSVLPAASIQVMCSRGVSPNGAVVNSGAVGILPDQ